LRLASDVSDRALEAVLRETVCRVKVDIRRLIQRVKQSARDAKFRRSRWNDIMDTGSGNFARLPVFRSPDAGTRLRAIVNIASLSRRLSRSTKSPRIIQLQKRLVCQPIAGNQDGRQRGVCVARHRARFPDSRSHQSTRQIERGREFQMRRRCAVSADKIQRTGGRGCFLASDAASFVTGSFNR